MRCILKRCHVCDSWGPYITACGFKNHCRYCGATEIKRNWIIDGSTGTDMVRGLPLNRFQYGSRWEWIVEWQYKKMSDGSVVPHKHLSFTNRRLAHLFRQHLWDSQKIYDTQVRAQEL